jgi:hypothetical protein
LAEVAAQTRVGQLPKFMALSIEWQRRLKYSSLNADASIRVYGSDQIWSFSNPAFEPDPVMFGLNDGGRKIAYAPSMGVITEDFTPPDWFSSTMETFSWVGVRDEGSKEFISKHSNINPHIVADPAFFLPSISETQIRSSDRHGLTIYCPRASVSVPSFLASPGTKSIGGFSTVEYFGYSPRRLFFSQFRNQFTSPLMLLDRISKSKLLLTSTFHGVVMALITRTPFIAVNSPNLRARFDNPVGKACSFAERLVNIEDLEAIEPEMLQRLMSSEIADYRQLSQIVLESEFLLTNALKDHSL